MRKFLLATVLMMCISFSACSEQNTTNSNNACSFQEDPVFAVNTEPLDLASFTECQKKWIRIAELFYISNLEISEKIDDKVKADLFLLLIASPLYEAQIKEYKTDGGYEFPLSFIEEIIFTHLETVEFDPQIGFSPQTGFQEYDPMEKIYKTKIIGGSGGAAVLGVLDYQQDQSTIKIYLGSYNMPDFFSEPPIYNLEEILKVEFSIDEGEENFKVRKIQKQKVN